MKWLAAIALLALVSACGKQEQLRPAPGKALPQKPAMAKDTPTADQLLTPSVEARPERNIEQVRRSRDRTEDPFDLPPPR